jgi:hypothetical protein
MNYFKAAFVLCLLVIGLIVILCSDTIFGNILGSVIIVVGVVISFTLKGKYN